MIPKVKFLDCKIVLILQCLKRIFSVKKCVRQNPPVSLTSGYNNFPWKYFYMIHLPYEIKVNGGTRLDGMSFEISPRTYYYFKNTHYNNLSEILFIHAYFNSRSWSPTERPRGTWPWIGHIALRDFLNFYYGHEFSHIPKIKENSKTNYPYPSPSFINYQFMADLVLSLLPPSSHSLNPTLNSWELSKEVTESYPAAIATTYILLWRLDFLVTLQSKHSHQRRNEHIFQGTLFTCSWFFINHIKEGDIFSSN